MDNINSCNQLRTMPLSEMEKDKHMKSLSVLMTCSIILDYAWLFAHSNNSLHVCADLKCLQWCALDKISTKWKMLNQDQAQNEHVIRSRNVSKTRATTEAWISKCSRIEVKRCLGIHFASLFVWLPISMMLRVHVNSKLNWSQQRKLSKIV